ncbi:uncharacterized histidine-rich protein DDB_G0274557-like [Cimex lectularius]|uniref:Uncharacterized protein n=1 Tax=Cimex lectularius TaxID=79782 RepID=A0A8I6RGI7_CIMLE|nr:uncharacterized histidine-rich protein DDB_G0274557-like [Cimex lectularius]
MKWLVVLFCYLACSRGTFLLPLLLYNLINPRQPAMTHKPEPPHYDFVKVYDHFDHHGDHHDDHHGHHGDHHDDHHDHHLDHHDDHHGHHGDHHDDHHDHHVDHHDDYHDHHHYKVVKLEPPKIKVIPGLVKISDPVVKVKVKVTKEKDYEDHTDKYDY